MAVAEITIKAVEAMPPDSEIRDTKCTGFIVRRRGKSETRTYSVNGRRFDGRLLRYNMGTHGEFTPETARTEAMAVRVRWRQGGDPQGEKMAQRHALTVNDIVDRYWTAACAKTLLVKGGKTKSDGTLQHNMSNIRCHIRPLLGDKRADAVTFADVTGFVATVMGGKHIAPRVKGCGRQAVGGKGAARSAERLLATIFAYAVKMEWVPKNPCLGVEVPRAGKREERLSAEQYAKLGEALRSPPVASTAATLLDRGMDRKAGMSAVIFRAIAPAELAAVRFQALTGWRKSEVIGLTWWEVPDLDSRTANLLHTKTGRSQRPMCAAAADVLRGIKATWQPRFSDDGLVFQPVSTAKRIDMNAVLRRLCLSVETKPFTSHIFRHSFNSEAADLEYSESTREALLGHKSSSVNAGYTHRADRVLLDAANHVGQHIQNLMGDGASADVTVLPFFPVRAKAG